MLRERATMLHYTRIVYLWFSSANGGNGHNISVSFARD
jgi:hypothetical protein